MINDHLSAFIKHRKGLIGKSDKAIIFEADIDRRREIIKGKPRGITFATADRLLRAVNSSWLEFSIWLKRNNYE